MNRKLRIEKLEDRQLLAGEVLGVINDVDHMYVGVGSDNNTAPTIVNPITIVGGNNITGTNVLVSALATDNRPEAGLRYYWSVVRAPEFPEDATVTFSANGSNAAKNIRMYFTTHGEYEIMVTVVDAKGLSVSNNLVFNVVRNVAKVTIASDTSGPMFVQTQRQYTATALDQFGKVIEDISPTWSVNTSSAGTVVNGLYTAGTRLGNFSVRATYTKPLGGTVTAYSNVSIVAPVLTSVSVSPVDSVVEAGKTQQYTMVAYNQLGGVITNAAIAWSATGGVINTAGLYVAGNEAGGFVVTGRATLNGVTLEQSVNVTVEVPVVVKVLTTIAITPVNKTVETGNTQQYQVFAYDQNGDAMSGGTVVWSTDGGTIDANGLFTAGALIGDYTVTANVTIDNVTVGRSTGVTVDWPTGKPQLSDSNLSQVVDFYFRDLFLDRNEMMSVLRYTGEDGSVNANELSDVRVIVTSTWYVMPEHIRALAYDVVNSNPANLKFKGQAAGNLQAGSSATLLNNLIDKWFLGVDVPIAGSNMVYVTSNGSVFNGPLNFNDAKQGYVGDCYFVASIISIAGRNPEKVTGMFIDNGDDTYTIRWHKAGVPTYVTVNKQLPTVGGRLQYAGLGQDALSSASILWGALLEKAYAQWNETGESGRNGTNTYSSLESGWMHNVNAQVLGYSSTNYSFSSSQESVIMDAVLTGKAVTVGTKSSVAGGWVAGHAYVVTGYNASTGKYTLTNPWGYNHLTVSWSEMQVNCTIFTTTFVT